MNTVIVGGGFAGVRAALEISKKNLGKVTLISDEDYFLHHATLYSTATGRSKAESVVPLSEIFKKHPDVKIVKDRMTSIDADRRLVIGGTKQYKYDKLVIAIGVVTTYFNIEGMKQHSYGIKTLAEVESFNKHLHKELIRDNHLDRNYIVIGAGPTGVELAGALSTYLQRIAVAHHLKRTKAKVTLVEAAPRILPRSSETASARVSKKLKEIGVKVLVNHKVEALDDDYIVIDGKKVSTNTAVWTSGVANHPFFAQHTDLFKLTPNGRVEVNQYLEAYRDIHVIGDNASTKYSGLAWNALDDASFLARHLARLASHQPLVVRKPTAPPSGIPVTEDWAYVEWKGIFSVGRLGVWLRRQIELYGYRQLLPATAARKAWKAHYIYDESCRLCKKPRGI